MDISDNNLKKIFKDLTEALRLVKNYLYDDNANSIVSANIRTASTAIQSALENLSFSNKEIEEREEEQQREWEEIENLKLMRSFSLSLTTASAASTFFISAKHIMCTSFPFEFTGTGG